MHCKLCKLWEQKDPQNKLKLIDKISFLYELLNWLENHNKIFRDFFKIVLTGGEPFLYLNQVLKIAKFCKTNDIKCYINTNGSIIKSYLKRILNSGLTALTISIDSHKAVIHDYLRGLKGLFNHLIKVIKKMKSIKEKKNYPIKLCVQSILGAWNINSLTTHIKFFENLGLDGIIFQPIQYPFGLPIPTNWYKNYDNFPISNKQIQYNLEYLRKTNYNGFVMNSKEEIELWQNYFINPEYLSDSINPCRAYDQNLIVDVSGNVKFCFNREINPKNKIGNILTSSLDDLWNGKAAIEEKFKMKSCNRACGIMACHIDTNLRNE